MTSLDLSKIQTELDNVATGLNKMQGMAIMADLLFAIAKSNHVCVSQDYFSKLRKLFVGKDYCEPDEGRSVYKLRYNKVINSEFNLIAEYIVADNLYLIKSIRTPSLTYACDETVPRLIIR
ncbi:MAG: hypothetical protein E7311_07280 [Clostridiales bacterium]|nr:hypothetical protein [Clostridiales bacterium]